jgi:hypothetical protein
VRGETGDRKLERKKPQKDGVRPRNRASSNCFIKEELEHAAGVSELYVLKGYKKQTYRTKNQRNIEARN